MAKILLVDDEESVLKALHKRLSKMGHDVAPARDGVEALEIFHSADFDLLITDFRMPRMDGIELMKRVREKHEALPVILITGTSTDDPTNFLKHGAQAYLLKPISKGDLEAVLQQVLSNV